MGFPSISQKTSEIPPQNQWAARAFFELGARKSRRKEGCMNEPVIVPPRRSLTRRQRVKLFDLRGGIRGIREPWIDEHMIPREISADDSIDNHWPLHVGAPVRPNRPPMMMLCALSTDGR